MLSQKRVLVRPIQLPCHPGNLYISVSSKEADIDGLLLVYDGNTAR